MIPHHRLLIAAALLSALGIFGTTVAARADDGDSAYDSLDDTDRGFRQQALQESLVAPIDARHHWSNIDSGHEGTFKVVRDKADAQGRVCRTITETLRDGGGQSAQGSIEACRTPVANHWQITRTTMAAYTPLPADLPPSSGVDFSAPGNVGGVQPQIPIQVWIDGDNYRNGGQRQGQMGQGQTSKGLTTQGKPGATNNSGGLRSP